MYKLLRSGAVFAAFLLASCGGGGGGAALSPGAPAATTAPSTLVPTKLAIVIPARIGSAAARDPRYVSPATAIVSVVVNGGAAQTFQVANGTPCATGASSPSGTCTIYSINAPVGTDTFAVVLLDASSHVLSQGTVQQTISLDTSNIVTITFDGVVNALRVSLANPSPPSGAAAKIPVTLLPVDAAGYTLVGAPGALPSITVNDPDTSGATGLYLAGNDGTCNTAAAAPAASVTTTQSGASYTLVCLNYTGAAVGTVSITASISGGPSGTAQFVPSQSSPAGVSGIWMVGSVPPSGAVMLERLDPTLAVTVAITGTQTNFGSVRVAALAVDPAGDVDVLTEYQSFATLTPQIVKYSGTTGGNVPPVSVTSFSLPSSQQTVDRFALAHNGVAGVYVVGSNGSSAFPSPGTRASCTIYSVPLNGSNATPSVAANCTNLVPNQNGGEGALRRAAGHVYLAINRAGATTGSTIGSIFRYIRNADASLTADSAISFAHGVVDFDVDPNGNVLAVASGAIEKYAAGGFVTGQNTTVTPIDTYSAGAPGHVGVDRASNIFFGGTAAGATNEVVSVIPSGTHAVSNSTPFSVDALASATSAAPGGTGAPLTAQPLSLELPPSPGSVTVTENGYSGPIFENDNCAGMATVSPKNAPGPSATFSVTQGQSGGTCTITFSDSGNAHVVNVRVGVTTTTIVGQGKGRRN